MKATASSGSKGTGASCAQSVSESGAGTLSAVILSLDRAMHCYMRVASINDVYMHTTPTYNNVHIKRNYNGCGLRALKKKCFRI